MKNPLVSVCLITYKHEKYIRQAIESILIQKVDFPWEIIIADDCSPDNTRAIILEYYQKHPDLIKLLFQEKNVGGGRNFVDLVKAAKGKYIAYIEGDDYWTDENKLQTQFDFLETSPSFSLCYHKTHSIHTYSIDFIPGICNEGDPPVSGIYDLLTTGWFIKSCSMFFRNIPLPEDFEKLYVGDYPLHILLAHKGPFGFIDKVMGTYRSNHEGHSMTRLLTDDFDKRKRNFEGENFLLDYLNHHTQHQYSRFFKKRKFDNIYSYLHFLFFKKRKKFYSELNYVLKTFELSYLTKQMITKVLIKLGYKYYTKEYHDTRA